MKELSNSELVPPFGRVRYRDDLTTQTREVEAIIDVKALSKGTKIGLAIDISRAADAVFRKRLCFPFQSCVSRHGRLAIRAMLSLLVRLSAEGKVPAVLWACSPDDAQIHELGNPDVEDVRKLNFARLDDRGAGSQLKPALDYFTDGRRRPDLYNAPLGMYIFIVSAPIVDIAAVKQLCVQLIHDIQHGWRNPLKLILIGLGLEVDADQLGQLGSLELYPGTYLWDIATVSEIEDLAETLARIIKEETFVILPSGGVIKDEKGNLRVKYETSEESTGLPVRLEFTLPTLAEAFCLEIQEGSFIQPMPWHPTEGVGILSKSPAKPRKRSNRFGKNGKNLERFGNRRIELKSVAGRYPVHMAADDCGHLYIAWSNGQIEAYWTERRKPRSLTLPQVLTASSALKQVVDMCAYQGDGASGCCVLAQTEADRILFRIANDGHIYTIKTDLPDSIERLACYEGRLYMYFSGARDDLKANEIPANAQGVYSPLCSEARMKICESILVGQKHLFLIGQSEAGKHCIWTSSRKHGDVWTCQSWENKIRTAGNLKEDYVYVCTKQEGKDVLIRFNPSAYSRILFPKPQALMGGNLMAGNASHLFVWNDDIPSTIFSYGHSWLNRKCDIAEYDLEESS